MKTYILFIFSLIIISCGGQNKKNEPHKVSNENEVIIISNSQIPNILLASIDSINPKIRKEILNNKKIEGLTINDCDDFSNYDYDAINGLFHLDKIIKGIYYKNTGNILIYDIYYPKESSKSVFEHIKKTITNTDDYRTYHDYLKTGKVFILDKNKITVIQYNPFTTPKNHDFIDKFLKNNISNFDAIIRVYGMNNVEIIK